MMYERRSRTPPARLHVRGVGYGALERHAQPGAAVAASGGRLQQRLAPLQQAGLAAGAAAPYANRLQAAAGGREAAAVLMGMLLQLVLLLLLARAAAAGAPTDEAHKGDVVDAAAAGARRAVGVARGGRAGGRGRGRGSTLLKGKRAMERAGGDGGGHTKGGGPETRPARIRPLGTERNMWA